MRFIEMLILWIGDSCCTTNVSIKNIFQSAAVEQSPGDTLPLNYYTLISMMMVLYFMKFELTRF